MTLLILILIAIPVCILTILLWIYNDYKKYKRQNCFLILLFWLYLPLYKLNTQTKIAV